MSAELFGIIITIAIFLLGIYFCKSRIVNILQFVWMAILLSFNTGGADYFNNYYAYKYSSGKFELGATYYSVLGHYFAEKGIEYTTFNGISSIIALFIIFYVINKKAQYFAFATSLFMLWPFADCVIQKRFFLGLPIILLAQQYIIEENPKKSDNIKYIALITAGFVLFHPSIGFYFIPIIYSLIPNKIRKKIIIVATILAGIFSGIIPTIINRLFPMLSSRSDLYFNVLSIKSTLGHYVFWVCWQLIYTLVFVYLHKRSPENNNVTQTLKLNYLMLPLLPFYSFDPVFTRLYRATMVENYIAFSTYAERGRIKKLYKFKICLFSILLSMINFIIFYVLTGNGFNQLVVPIFTNNIIIKAIIS